ncbi:hypothetical protein EBU71_07975 [bacterium]|jgi:hypothetical protein|nr:hypothetical protein [Candidatus Elulimicrobium humile]
MAHDKNDIFFFGSMTVIFIIMILGAISSMVDTNEFTEKCNDRNGVAVMTTTGLACVDKGVILR